LRPQAPVNSPALGTCARRAVATPRDAKADVARRRVRRVGMARRFPFRLQMAEHDEDDVISSSPTAHVHVKSS